MARKASLDAPATLHHVMIRGIEGDKIFCDDEDRGNFLARIGKLIESTGTRILAWVLMNNHVHLLLFSGPTGISSFMRRLLSGYAVWFNRKHRRSGHLFQNRYKSIVCEEDSYLLELVRYIHLNPLRASVVRSMAELDHYRWSGHSVLVGKSRSDWQEKQYVLSQFGERQGRAVRAYQKYMEEEKDIGKRPELVGGGLVRNVGGWSRVISLRDKGEREGHDRRVLGSKDFVQRVMREADDRLMRQMRNGRSKGCIEGVIRKMCNEAGVKEEEVRGGGAEEKGVEGPGENRLLFE